MQCGKMQNVFIGYNLTLLRQKALKLDEIRIKFMGTFLWKKNQFKLLRSMKWFIYGIKTTTTTTNHVPVPNVFTFQPYQSMWKKKAKCFHTKIHLYLFSFHMFPKQVKETSPHMLSHNIYKNPSLVLFFAFFFLRFVTRWGKLTNLYNLASLKKQDFNACLWKRKVLFHGKFRQLQNTKISQHLHFHFFPLITIWRSTVFHNHRVIKQLEVNPVTILVQHTNMFIDKAVILLNNLST